MTDKELNSIKMDLQIILGALTDMIRTIDNAQGHCEKEPVNKNVPISHLNLGARPYNILRRAGIKTIEELENTSVYDLRRIRCMGRKSLEEIQEALAEFNATV